MKLDTAAGILKWAEWMENTDSRITHKPGQATAEHLAYCVRVTNLLEDDMRCDHHETAEWAGSILTEAEKENP